MVSNCMTLWFTPISSNIVVFISLVLSIIAAVFLFIIGIFSFSNKLLISMIVFIISIVLTFALTLYTAIVYQSANNGNESIQQSISNLKKKFLMIINIIFIIVLAAMSFCLYSFRGDFYELTDIIFKDYYNDETNVLSASLSSNPSEKFVKFIENYFKCQRFDSNSPSGNCAELIKDFLNKKAMLLSIILGVVSVICLILLVIAIFVDYKSKPDHGTKNDRSGNASNELNEELNPNEAAEF